MNALMRWPVIAHEMHMRRRRLVSIWYGSRETVQFHLIKRCIFSMIDTPRHTISFKNINEMLSAVRYKCDTEQMFS